MESHHFATRDGGAIELDICFACQGLWFDPRENLQLAPGSVLALFELLHRHRDDARHPLSDRLRCPRCRQGLAHGFDIVRSGRYVTYRCPQQHGRFATFSSFMVEKGFVRQMTKPEIEDLARRVDAIFCTGCGAPVDIRRDHACPHCRAAFSLLDPAAVEKALQRHAAAAQRPDTPAARTDKLADALMVIERDRLRTKREERKDDSTVDLWAAGVELVWSALSR
jgi:Zn-finger nucleic acid-binding protein